MKEGRSEGCNMSDCPIGRTICIAQINNRTNLHSVLIGKLRFLFRSPSQRLEVVDVVAVVAADMDWGGCLGGVILSTAHPPRADEGWSSWLSSSNSCSSSSSSWSSVLRTTIGDSATDNGDDVDDDDDMGARGTDILIRGVLLDNNDMLVVAMLLLVVSSQ
jgi:hypothetical protein